MKRTGKCLCESVTFTADVSEELSACHCAMCRRWTGGPMFGLEAKDVAWEGDDNITVAKTSPWAERAFCNKCGSGLFYRVTSPGKYQGMTSLPLGILDDQSGFDLNKEWFSDLKPDAYTLAGERKCFTEAEVQAMFEGA